MNRLYMLKIDANIGLKFILSISMLNNTTSLEVSR
jgi:hypothetical protein